MGKGGSAPSGASTSTLCSIKCSNFDRLRRDAASPLLRPSSSSKTPTSWSHRRSGAMPRQLLRRSAALPNRRRLLKPPLPQAVKVLASSAIASACSTAGSSAGTSTSSTSARTLPAARAIQAQSERRKGSTRDRSGS